jgi:hypothetical protein
VLTQRASAGRPASSSLQSNFGATAPKHHRKTGIIKDQKTKPGNRKHNPVRSAKPPSPVQIRAAPPKSLRKTHRLFPGDTIKCAQMFSNRDGDTVRWFRKSLDGLELPDTRCAGEEVSRTSAQLSSRTFWTFAREFSPFTAARVLEDQRVYSLTPFRPLSRGPGAVLPFGHLEAHECVRPAGGVMVSSRGSCGRSEGRARLAGRRSVALRACSARGGCA